jgi:hypothetical protein
MLLPKVVSFEMNGSELALMEQNIYSIYSEVPAGKLLQSFPVESQDSDTVTFRWAYGLVSVPQKPFYVSSDQSDSAKAQVSASETALPIVASYLKYARIANNRLELRQVARVRSSELTIQESSVGSTTKEESVQLDIAFAPYAPNPRFQPRLSTRLRGVGFFEIAQVRKDEGNLDAYASRWDLSPEAGPITYAISKTAPAEAVAAMREGVEYWNDVARAALKRDIIKVELNADPDSPPAPRRVMVYWVPFSRAGGAYANFQPDPLTGEITSGLVYQTSVFFLSGRSRGRRFVNRGLENTPKPGILPAGFLPASLCSFESPPFAGMDPLLEGNDEKIGRKMGLDYLRSVVAHEVGHTLGLRHNFAGTMASEFASPTEAREKFREYLNDDHHTGAVPSSTVMDYSTFRDSVMEGAAIAAKKPFPYDRAAVAWAYSDTAPPLSELNPPPYCADLENGKSLGCASWDTTQRPMAGYAEEMARSRLLAADVLLETILDAIRPDNPLDAITIRQALGKSHPDALSLAIFTDAPNIFRFGGAAIKALAIDRKEEGQDWTNKEEYAAQTGAYLRREFEFAGGLPGILRTAYGLDESFKAKRGWLLEALRARLASRDLHQGKTLGGKPFELSDAEVRDVKAACEKLADPVENALLRDLLASVTGLNPNSLSGGAGKTTLAALSSYPSDETNAYNKAVAEDSWQSALEALATQLATESEGEVEGTVDGNPVKVPAPRFPLEPRVAAMRLLSPKVFSRTKDAWQKDARQKLADALTARLAPVLKLADGNPDNASPAGKQVSPELQDWARQELAVAKALKAAGQ